MFCFTDAASIDKGKGKVKVEEEEEEGEDNEAGVNKDEEEELEDEEEEGDDALAWQMLETARCILSKESKRSLLEVDVVTTLADMSLEKGEGKENPG